MDEMHVTSKYMHVASCLVSLTRTLMIMANGFGDNPNLGPHTVQVTENDIWYSIACRSCKGLGSFNQLLVSRNDNARSRWPGGPRLQFLA